MVNYMPVVEACRRRIQERHNPNEIHIIFGRTSFSFKYETNIESHSGDRQLVFLCEYMITPSVARNREAFKWLMVYVIRSLLRYISPYLFAYIKNYKKNKSRIFFSCFQLYELIKSSLSISQSIHRFAFAFIHYPSTVFMDHVPKSRPGTCTGELLFILCIAANISVEQCR